MTGDESYGCCFGTVIMAVDQHETMGGRFMLDSLLLLVSDFPATKERDERDERERRSTEEGDVMNILKYEPKHSIVALLDDSIPEADGYQEMIHFLRRTKYVYAMCAKPIVYARLIKAFWKSAEVITDEAGSVGPINTFESVI
ncbi:hypothetical protein QVD17_16702 [Tagetes erecta]|uniref:Uncharacterized protein n=1 Tax=Tagetes erecta TaxID=13708 RepID=A0AAD8KVK1_TARER|nr:hypothetical protein QVD17_16702 [Tagetes erecta]